MIDCPPHQVIFHDEAASNVKILNKFFGSKKSLFCKHSSLGCDITVVVMTNFGNMVRDLFYQPAGVHPDK
jgi:hypothetical protein